MSSHDNEVTIPMAAVDGLWRLARGGVQEAAQALLEAVAHPEYAVRAVAVQAYLHRDINQEEARVEVSKYLKPEELSLLDLQWLKAPPRKDPPEGGIPVQPVDENASPPPSINEGGNQL